MIQNKARTEAELTVRTASAKPAGVISVIIPTLNAGTTLGPTLAALVPAAVDGAVKEVVVADGGSEDETLDIAEDAGAGVVRAEQGRGRQLAAGCRAAGGGWLLALHADTRLGPGWADAAVRHMAESPGQAGWFRFKLDDCHPLARVWEAGVACRSTMGLPYGDQGLLLSRRLYDEVGGYPAWSLMEDAEIARRLGPKRLRGIPADALTSAERYRKTGYLGRSARNWMLVARWRLGADPERLAREYR